MYGVLILDQNVGEGKMEGEIKMIINVLLFKVYQSGSPQRGHRSDRTRPAADTIQLGD